MPPIPANWGKLADEAKSRLPDRPEVSGDLRRRFIEHSTANVTELRETAMLDLVRTYKVDLKQPEKAAATERTWLDHQRKTYLGANNSEQRVELALMPTGYPDPARYVPCPSRRSMTAK